MTRASGAQWQSARERGSAPLNRAMIWLSLRLGRPLTRLLLYPIALYFLLFAPSAARHSRQYLQRALGRPPRVAERFRHILVFATTLLDRLYLAHGRGQLLRVTVEGDAPMRQHLAAGKGVFLMGAHLGCFEVIGTVAEDARGLKIVMAMYTDNTGHMGEQLRAARTPADPEVIPLGRLDAMLRLRDRLDAGAFVGMLADRTFGETAARSVPFLGQPALFPTGPMRIAAALRRPVMFMSGLYRGANHYHVVFRELADFSGAAAGGREAAVHAAVERFAAVVEGCCRSDTFNWFNFYDFWHGAPG